MRIGTVLTTVLLGLGGVTAAVAQLNELRSTQDGRGNLSFRTRSSARNVDRIDVQLKNNGDANIWIKSGELVQFSGRWRNDGNRRVRLMIDKVDSDWANAIGSVEHDGRGRFTRVDFSGTVRNDRLSFVFDANNNSGGGGDWTGGGSPTEIRSTKDGGGDWDSPDNRRVERARKLYVSLNRNHDFEIRIYNSTRQMGTIKGRWWFDTGRRVHLDVDRVDSSSATGSGTVQLDGRGGFERVNVSGREGGDFYSLNFNADASWGGGGGGNPSGPGWENDFNGEDRKFRDNGRDAIKRKIDRDADFSWSEEVLSNPVFGNRTYKGRVRVRNGRNNGTYNFTVVMGAGTASVKSVNYTRD